ncbi:carbonic anhydrase 2-like [Planococcus citri]|uniref:carbonic anhydrase 2-like n=1 Tax=Planococcus citri TaxID=170843 RepID=UPI0031F7E7D1
MHFPSVFFLQLCVLIGASNLPSAYSKSKSDNSQLFLGKYPIPKKTPDPININTKNIKKFDNLSNSTLTIHGYINTRVKVINTGKLVKVILNQPSTKTSVTGGVLGNDRYQLKKIKYYWTNNTKGTAATTIDGKGFPLEDMGIFFNQKYGTFKNALNYRDGLAEVIFPIEVCSKPNLYYKKFVKKLKRIRQAGSFAKTTLQKAIQFLAGDGVISRNTIYYAYPGSYRDENTGKIYYCATVIIITYDPPLCISKKQFKRTFGSFKNAAGQPLTNTASQFPAKMPIVQAIGVSNYNYP